MIIDDAKNSLASLRSEISEETRVKSKDDLHVGDILSLEMDEKDGLKLRGGYKTRDKFVVVIGINSKGDAIGALLINSEIDYTKDTPELKPFQYPMKKFFTPACRLTHAKGAKVITIVHDLGAFRRHKLTIEQENRRLANSDVIIVHNERMKEHLLANGCKQSIITLGIFDYLTETESSPSEKGISSARWRSPATWPDGATNSSTIWKKRPPHGLWRHTAKASTSRTKATPIFTTTT